MAIVNQVEKRVKLPKWDIVKYQLLTHCFLNKITMSESDLNCLTLLCLNQPIELSHFCVDVSTDEDWIFKTPQTVRNCINKAEKVGLIIKNSTNKKEILINPKLKILTEDVVLLDYKFLSNDSKES